MKKSNSKSKAQSAFKKWGAVALITATIFFVACKQIGGGGGESTPKHAITFNVDSTTPNGTLKAKAEGLPETEASPITIEQGKVITFKAEAKAGYSVKSWTLDGKPITLAGTKAEYQHTVTAPCTIKVSFLAGGATYTVKHYQERAEGDYPAEPTESETLNGTVDGEASYTAKTYEGFTQKADFTKINGRLTQTGTVLADGNTIVELFYERNTVSLTFHLAGGNIEGKTDDIVKTGKYGTPFTAPAEPAKATGIFKGWKPQLPTPLLFPASNAEHTAEWTPKALLTLEAGKNTVKVKAKTADGKPITVEGCTVNELANEAETTLTVTDPERKLALIGDIIELNCSGEETPGGNRPLIALDASGCTALQKLDCAKNQLTALHVHGCTALQKLNCRFNKLTALNVQGLTALQELKCYENKLTALNVQGLTSLRMLSRHNNQLTALDVQGLTALQTLDCSVNQLPELNVQGLTALQKLYCSENQLTALNVQGLTALQGLSCEGNKLTELDVQGLTKLQKLECEENQLAKLNASGLTELKEINCNENQLTELNVQGCTALKSLYCRSNQLGVEAMKDLLNALPQREASEDPSASAVALLYTEETGKTEGNYKDFNKPTTPADLKTAFEDAKSRKWQLKKFNASGDKVDI